MKKIMSLAAAMLLLMHLHAGASELLSTGVRQISTDGWYDTFDTPFYGGGNPVINSEQLTITSAPGVFKNLIGIGEDPLGVNGKSLEFHFEEFSQTKFSAGWNNNPQIAPLIRTTGWVQENIFHMPGGASLSFDMYLPQGFYSDGEDVSGIDFTVLHGVANTSQSSTWTFRQEGLTLPVGEDGKTTYPLPVGRWFNIRFVIHTNDCPNGHPYAHCDLFIDGEKVVDNEDYLLDGTFSLTRAVGIQSVRFTLVTTNSGRSFEPYNVYADNLDIRALQPLEVVDYRFLHNGLEAEKLAGGTTECRAMIHNYSSVAAANPVLLLMVVKDGMMQSISCSDEVTIDAGGEEELTASVELTEVDESCEIRAFLWDGLQEANSLMNVIKFRP